MKEDLELGMASTSGRSPRRHGAPREISRNGTRTTLARPQIVTRLSPRSPSDDRPSRRDDQGRASGYGGETSGKGVNPWSALLAAAPFGT